MEKEDKTEIPEEEVDVKKWLRNIIPESDEEQGDLSMDTGILDEDEQSDVEKPSDIDKPPHKVEQPPPPPPPPMPQACMGFADVDNRLTTSSSTGSAINPIAGSSKEAEVPSLAPTSDNKPVNSQLKELYSLNSIARAKKNQVPILGGG